MVRRYFAVWADRMAYDAAWNLQRRILNARRNGFTDDVLLLLEHPHTYTIGKSGGERHLLIREETLAENGVHVHRVDRGGDITYHGPGQLVGYPIFDLNQYYRDVYRYLRDLEEVVIRTVADYGIAARRIEGLTGVWVRDEKIAALGVKMSWWITMHGFALNVDTDLRRFDAIIPCGIEQKGVTSMTRLLDRPVGLHEVTDRIIAHMGDVFHIVPETMSYRKLLALMDEWTNGR